eukprot:6757506-Prymnesium_polylepis.1
MSDPVPCPCATRPQLVLFVAQLRSCVLVVPTQGGWCHRPRASFGEVLGRHGASFGRHELIKGCACGGSELAGVPGRGNTAHWLQLQTT